MNSPVFPPAEPQGSPPPTDHPIAVSPNNLDRTTWWYAIRRTVREFRDDDCLDLAAGLTYYSVLSLFPALAALLSLVAIIGDPQTAVATLTSTVGQVAGSSVSDSLEPILVDLSRSSDAGWGLLLGLVGALWTASGYVGAFGRAMNRIYEVPEGRPIWKLRPAMLALTALVVSLAALTLVGLVISGPVADAVGSTIGLGDLAVTLWGIIKWPVMALIVASIVALLYYFTPNVRVGSFRWISPGAVVAILIWAAGSALFAVYVANFTNYDKVYGSLAGAIVLLLWLWLTNLALLFGAELNAELERGRELEADQPAEEEIQLPLRDDHGVKKADAVEHKQIAEAQDIRLENRQ